MKEFKVGDIIKTYHKGIYRLVRIEERVTKNPLLHYTMILDSNLKPRKSGEMCCDSGFCKKITAMILAGERDAKIKAVKEGYETLMELIEEKKEKDGKDLEQE